MTIEQSVQTFWDKEALPALMDFIRIPAKSTAFDSHWQEHGYLLQACEKSKAWIESVLPQARCEILTQKDRTPCLFVDIAADGTTRDNTIAFYGHLDKQPEAGGWAKGLGPWEPVIRNGKLYGRGAADDGYSLFAMVTAIVALKREQVPHPRIVGIFETQEESGSTDLPEYLKLLKDDIGNPAAFIILDNHCGDYERLWLSTSLRGVISGTLRVQSMHYGVHSGSYSGMVPDPFSIAQALVERLHDPITGFVKVSECHADIPKRRIEQLKKASDVLGDLVWNHAPFVEGVQTKHISNHEIFLQQTWKPALTVIGVDGMPKIEDAGNVVQGSVALRLSMRVPPMIDFEKAAQAVENELLRDPPYGCKVSWRYQENHEGWCASSDSEEFETLFSDASKQVFGQEAVMMGQGGSISIINTFERLFPGTSLILTGVLGPQSNAHAPNESLDLDYVVRLTQSLCYVLPRCA